MTDYGHTCASGPQSRKSTIRSSSSRQTTSMSSERSQELSADPLMLTAKISRKRAEGNLQLLANRSESSDAYDVQMIVCVYSSYVLIHSRIALLRTEEQKAKGKISETEARAKEILEIKKRNEMNLQERFSLSLQVRFKNIFMRKSSNVIPCNSLKVLKSNFIEVGESYANPNLIFILSENDSHLIDVIEGDGCKGSTR